MRKVPKSDPRKGLVKVPMSDPRKGIVKVKRTIKYNPRKVA